MPDIAASLYHYKAIVQSVYDADTMRIDISLGMGLWKLNEPVRLLGINAPELRGPEREEGIKSRDWVRERMPDGKEILVRTHLDKSGKYGRLLADIFYSSSGGVLWLNQEIVKAGMAQLAEY